MRRVSFLMVLAIAAFMSLGTSGALASAKGAKPGSCKYGKSNGKCKPKPKDCTYGTVGKKCKPKPDPKPAPKPPECPDGKCEPAAPPVVVEPPKGGPCSKADLVLLEDLLKGTGALVCLYLGDNSPNATADLDCPDALIALPIDNLLGACVYLPPTDVDRAAAASGAGSVGAAASSAVDDATAGSGVNGLQGLVSELTSLLELGQ